MIKIPIEIGDIVYVGRFKNKRVVVKSIEYNYNTQDPEYKFTTTMILGRKNWLPEPKVENKE